MIDNAMSLKAKIRNMAKQKNISAQVVLQMYMFERFLERLLKSGYHDKFILKGGVLVSAIVGFGNRATMDIDTTLINYPMDREYIIKAINDICHLKVDDNTSFQIKRIDSIREDDIYGGFRASLEATYDKSIVVPLQLDITTGDVITPSEELIEYRLLFSENTIKILAYNIETILAEKVETILVRGEFNTRPRDFYDIYALSVFGNYSIGIFEEALKNTAIHRESNHIFKNMDIRIQEISNSRVLKSRWISYSRDYGYASQITYNDVMEALRRLVKNFYKDEY